MLPFGSNFPQVILKGLRSSGEVMSPNSSIGEEKLAVRSESEIQKLGHQLRWEFLLKALGKALCMPRSGKIGEG